MFTKDIPPAPEFCNFAAEPDAAQAHSKALAEWQRSLCNVDGRIHGISDLHEFLCRPPTLMLDEEMSHGI